MVEKERMERVLLPAFLFPYVHLHAVYRCASINFCYVFSALSKSELHNFNWQGKAISCEGAYTRTLTKIDQLLPPGRKRKANYLLHRIKKHILQKNICQRLEWNRS